MTNKKRIYFAPQPSGNTHVFPHPMVLVHSVPIPMVHSVPIPMVQPRLPLVFCCPHPHAAL